MGAAAAEHVHGRDRRNIWALVERPVFGVVHRLSLSPPNGAVGWCIERNGPSFDANNNRRSFHLR